LARVFGSRDFLADAGSIVSGRIHSRLDTVELPAPARLNARSQLVFQAFRQFILFLLIGKLARFQLPHPGAGNRSVRAALSFLYERNE